MYILFSYVWFDAENATCFVCGMNVVEDMFTKRRNTFYIGLLFSTQSYHAGL